MDKYVHIDVVLCKQKHKTQRKDGEPMYTKQSKKMMAFDILEVLQRYTDENHRLSQEEIRQILRDKYDMEVDRRSIKRNLMDLMDMGVDIQYSECTRMMRDKQTGEDEEQSIMTDFYLQRDFSDCEIRLLIDELMDLKYIPYGQRKQLITKLEGLSSIYFKKNHRNRDGKVERENTNSQLFYTLDIIDEALSKKAMVQFFYRHYYADDNGKINIQHEKYIVSPYETVLSKGRYLLVCDDDNGLKEFRLDYIYDIILVEGKTMERICDRDGRRCETANVKILIGETILEEYIDEFGIEGVTIRRAKEGLAISAKLDINMVLGFAIRNPGMVEVLSPASLRTKVVKMYQKGLQKYDYIA